MSLTVARSLAATQRDEDTARELLAAEAQLLAQEKEAYLGTGQSARA